MIFVGTTGYIYSDWKGKFYPVGLQDRELLKHYGKYFSTVALNFTHYKNPTIEQLNQIINATPPSMQFCVKAHKSISHDRCAGDSDIKEFCNSLTPLVEAEKFGSLLLQFPNSFKKTDMNVKYLEGLVSKITLPLVVEFNDRGWTDIESIKMLKELQVGYCCVDEPSLEGLMPRMSVSTSDEIAYVRFNGRNGKKWFKHNCIDERYNYLYKHEELYQWAKMIKELDEKSKKTFVYFNNYTDAKAVKNAKEMIKLCL